MNFQTSDISDFRLIQFIEGSQYNGFVYFGFFLVFD